MKQEGFLQPRKIINIEIITNSTDSVRYCTKCRQLTNAVIIYLQRLLTGRCWERKVDNFLNANVLHTHRNDLYHIATQRKAISTICKSSRYVLEASEPSSAETDLQRDDVQFQAERTSQSRQTPLTNRACFQYNRMTDLIILYSTKFLRELHRT